MDQEKKGFIILPREDGRWLLTRDGTPAESSIHDSLAEAIRKGRTRARKENVRLRILNRTRRPFHDRA